MKLFGRSVRKYTGQLEQKNARCCHCHRIFDWDADTGEVYKGKFLCPDCYQDDFGNCDRCGRLRKYTDTNLFEIDKYGELICDDCMKLERRKRK